MRWLRAHGAALALLALAGCSGGPEELPADGPPRPRADVDLAGRTEARAVQFPAELPAGPGADGTPGDFLLQNSVVKFVVAAPGGLRSGGAGGNVIDAVPHGGEDRLRLMRPELGRDPPVWPVYTRAAVLKEGGERLPASVEAAGHLPGRPDVLVRTVYTLVPDSYGLDVTTTVTNIGRGPRAGFALGDAVMPGRARRFVPEAGLDFVGHSPPGTWISFHGPVCVLGVVCEPGKRMTGVHDAGASRLSYGRVDLGPGEARSYTRRLLAAPGGPERVWLAAQPIADEPARLEMKLADKSSGQPVAGAEIGVVPQEGGSPFMAVADDEGVLELVLPAGGYVIAARAAGRPPWGPATVTCKAGGRHSLPIPMTQAAGAVVSVSAEVDGVAVPGPARICAYGGGSAGAAGLIAPPFPVQPPCGVALAEGVEPMRVPLAAASDRASGRYALIASRGPLYQCVAARERVAAGEESMRDAVLQRLIDPGDYVAVDLRQYAHSSPDCALTQNERLLANRCEGLDAAVVCEPFAAEAARCVQPTVGNPLLPGVRLDVPGVGAFSVYPARAGRDETNAVAEAMAGEQGAGAVLARARELWPDAIIQADRPLDPRTGCIALAAPRGWDGTRLPGGLATGFDAVEILSGRDVGAARRMLPLWFALLNDGRRVIATGGSGSRAIVGEEAGAARTYVHCPDRRPGFVAADVRSALAGLRTDEPNAFVSNGPFIEAALDGRPIGSRLEVRARGLVMDVKVRAAPWVDVSRITLYRNGRVERRERIAPGTDVLRCERVFDVDVVEDCWFVVVVEGERPMSILYGKNGAPTPFAVTNPFWVHVVGD